LHHSAYAAIIDLLCAAFADALDYISNFFNPETLCQAQAGRDEECADDDDTDNEERALNGQGHPTLRSEVLIVASLELNKVESSAFDLVFNADIVPNCPACASPARTHMNDGAFQTLSFLASSFRNACG
jgi:hypothetical protein